MSHPSPALADTRSAAWRAWRASDWQLMAWMGAGRADRHWRLRLAIGLAHWSWVPLALCLVLCAVQRAGALVPVATAMGLATLVQVLAKRGARWLSAPRPFALGLCPNHLNHGERGGMPSTHAAVMGCLAGALSPWMAMWPELALMPAIAALTGWARVQAGAHFPSDVLVGLALGGALGRQAMAALA